MTVPVITPQVVRLAEASGRYTRWKTKGIAPLEIPRPLYVRLRDAGCRMDDLFPAAPREAGRLF